MLFIRLSMEKLNHRKSHLSANTMMKSKISTLDKIALMLFVILFTMMSFLVIHYKKTSVPHDLHKSELNNVSIEVINR
jgi:hypothetical protein